MVFFKPRDPRPLLAAAPTERLRIVRGLLKKLDLHRFVSGITIIPGITIQLVCPIGWVHAINTVLLEHNLTIVDTPNRFEVPPKSSLTPEQSTTATARQLAYLCTQSKSRNFQHTVLDGASAQLHQETLTIYRQLVSQPKAELGHWGRPYSKGKEPAGEFTPGEDMEMGSGPIEETSGTNQGPVGPVLAGPQ